MLLCGQRFVRPGLQITLLASQFCAPGYLTYEKPVIGKTTTSPAVIFPVEFIGSARLLKEAHLKIGFSDSQSVLTVFVNAGGPVNSRISTSLSFVAFCMISLVT